MLTQQQLLNARARAREYLERAGIVLTSDESEHIEVADFGLGELETTGLEEETFRCQWGRVYLYVEGVATHNAAAKLPAGHEHAYTIWHEAALVSLHTVY